MRQLPAIAVVAAVTALLVFGVRESARVNNFFVVLKGSSSRIHFPDAIAQTNILILVTITLMFIFAGIKFINPQNYKPFIPPQEGPKKYGVPGIFAGAVTGPCHALCLYITNSVY